MQNNDLISRSALLELAHNHVGGTVDCNDIARFPTIDAVEVVRCKDCMHSNHVVIDDDPAETFEVDVCLHKDLFPTRVTPDFYCAHGERKMDAEVEGC